MINRRNFLGVATGVGATLVLTPDLLRAIQLTSGKLIERAIPSTGEKLPAISYGPRQTDGAAIKEVLKTLVDNGGKVVDVLHGGPAGEQGSRTAAAELGIQNKMFWTTPLSVSVPVLPGYTGPELKADIATVKAAMDEKFARFKVPMIDLVMVASSADMTTHLPALRELKKAGRIRYIGVHHLAFPVGAPMPPFGELESVMRNEQIDFIGTDYSIGDRRLEEKILPLAMERKIGVMAYFPFDRSRIFERASSTPLPAWAAEFDAKTWAQFFIKYVLSHPAVTVVRTGTTKAEHMLDNIGGGIGRLPDEAMRKRMAQLVDSFPPTPAAAPKPQQPPPQVQPIALSAAILDRYVGEYKYATSGQTVSIRRNGDKLFAKVSGNMPEGPLVARSETRFDVPWPESTIEFQVDAQGKVTGATVDQFAGGQILHLDRSAPVVVSAAVLDRYVGEYKSAAGFTVTFRREGTALIVKPGPNPETTLITRSEIRFEDPRGPAFEFQVDAQGKVTGAILQQGAQRIPLERQ
jgi:aryl-alcohol dehydrogenase-like predicted oxidoreductase